VAADIESEALMLHGAADAADIDGILLDHRHRLARLGQQVGGGQARGPGTDDGNVDLIRMRTHARLPGRY
jgi:hypothetical protein